MTRVKTFEANRFYSGNVGHILATDVSKAEVILSFELITRLMALFENL